MTVDLWLFRNDVALPNELTDALSPEERARAAKQRSDLRRTQYLATRSVGRFLLARSLGCQPRDVVWAPSGPPQLAGRKGAKVALSVSHSGPHSALAFSVKASRLGVDVECFAPPLKPLAIQQSTFTARERDQLTQLAPEAAEALFRRMWVLKEAIWKSQGPGDTSSAAVPEIEAIPEPDEPGGWRLRPWPGTAAAPAQPISLIEFLIREDASGEWQLISGVSRRMLQAEGQQPLAWGALICSTDAAGAGSEVKFTPVPTHDLRSHLPGLQLIGARCG